MEAPLPCGELADPTPPPDRDHPAVELWVTVGFAVLLFLIADAALALMGKHTMSTVAQHWFARHLRIAIVVFSVLVMGAWHIVWGFPW